MKALDKIIGTVNILLFVGLIYLIIQMLPAIVSLASSILGISLFVVLPLVVIIWGFINSLKYIRNKETKFGDYTFLERILIIIPTLNFSFIVLVTLGSLIYLVK